MWKHACRYFLQVLADRRPRVHAYYVKWMQIMHKIEQRVLLRNSATAMILLPFQNKIYLSLNNSTEKCAKLQDQIHIVRTKKMISLEEHVSKYSSRVQLAVLQPEKSEV